MRMTRVHTALHFLLTPAPPPPLPLFLPSVVHSRWLIAGDTRSHARERERKKGGDISRRDNGTIIRANNDDVGNATGKEWTLTRERPACRTEGLDAKSEGVHFSGLV